MICIQKEGSPTSTSPTCMTESLSQTQSITLPTSDEETDKNLYMAMQMTQQCLQKSYK